MLVFLTSLVGVVPLAGRALPVWHPLVAPQPGCISSCWQGIHVNRTGYSEAIDLLRGNPRMVQVDTRQQIYAQNQQYIWYLYWTWQAETGETVRGSIAVQAGIVRLVRIYQEIPLGLLRVLLGEPQQGSFVGTLIYRAEQPIHLPLYHTAVYTDSAITLQTEASCARFWWQPTMVTIRAGEAVGEPYNLSAYRRYACTGWQP